MKTPSIVSTVCYDYDHLTSKYYILVVRHKNGLLTNIGGKIDKKGVGRAKFAFKDETPIAAIKGEFIEEANSLPGDFVPDFETFSKRCLKVGNKNMAVFVGRVLRNMVPPKKYPNNEYETMERCWFEFEELMKRDDMPYKFKKTIFIMIKTIVIRETYFKTPIDKLPRFFNRKLESQFEGIKV